MEAIFSRFTMFYCCLLKFLTAVFNFRTCILRTQFANIFDTSYIGLAFPKTFATACSKTPTTRNEIGLLPGALYSTSSLSACVVSAPWLLDMPKMVPDQSTIVVIHDLDYRYSDERRLDPNKTRHALITPIDEEHSPANER